jgi:hypothetical protein
VRYAPLVPRLLPRIAAPLLALALGCANGGASTDDNPVVDAHGADASNFDMGHLADSSEGGPTDTGVLDDGSATDTGGTDDTGSIADTTPVPDTSPPPLPEPSSSCVVPDATEATLSASPSAPAPSVAVRFTAADSAGLTNVWVRLCTPTGVVDYLSVTGLDASSSPIRWWWDTAGMPRGYTQASFRADPGKKVYATLRVKVE